MPKSSMAIRTPIWCSSASRSAIRPSSSTRIRSLTSTVSAVEGRPVSARMAATWAVKPGAVIWRADRLTATPTSHEARRQAAPCAQASRTTHSPSGTTRPDSSAAPRNSRGATTSPPRPPRPRAPGPRPVGCPPAPGQARARGAGDVPAGHPERPGGTPAAQPCGDLGERRRAARVLDQDGELVTAPARDRVVDRDGGTQPPGGLGQHQVAGAVPDRVVDRGEAVQVEKDDADPAGWRGGPQYVAGPPLRLCR